ncbi:MAG TPA: DinB family protein [Thermoanaerobaculia bacterium]|nr:DinB family protein [Thermoanaerobaculia bacterium]
MRFPEPDEVAPYYFTYINRVDRSQGDIVGLLESQLDETLALLSGISEEKSLHRYAPEKWSLRELLNHVSDTERVFLFRALWFGRGFDSPLPSFDEKISAATARADEVSWARHVEEFRAVRLATLTFFQNLPAEAWMRSGTASGNPFTVNALAYITAGHLAHHIAILRERYL